MRTGTEERLVEELAGECRSGFMTAAQVFVALEGEVVCDVAVGDAVPGQPVTTQTTFNLHCATKPVVALALARALEDHGFEPDVPVVELLDLDGSPDLTVQHLCSHDAGLGAPDAFSCNLQSVDELSTALDPRHLIERAEPGVAEYSEVAAWHLLGLCIEHLAGLPADRYVAEGLEALGLAGAIWTSAADAFAVTGSEPRASIGCYHDTNTGLPLLHDRVAQFWNRGLNLSEGGYASISGLGRWYMAVLDVLRGGRQPALPSATYLRRWLAHERGRVVDRRLGRPCSFANGFMRGLRDHNFGTAPAADAFGHAGFLGNSFVIAEPARGTVVGCFRNGISADPHHNVNVLRPADVAQLYGLVAS